MKLPLIDVFSPAYEVWNTRAPTREEILASGRIEPIKESMKATIDDARSAALYAARYECDSGLENYIKEKLNEENRYQAWLKEMPSKAPSEISRYQNAYNTADLSAVSSAIEWHGKPLSSGQSLFHGGLWPGADRMATTRPLSTSFSPFVAFQNALWSGKAYEAGRVDLWVLHVNAPGLKAYPFKLSGRRLAHEKEVLLASGATLTRISENLVRDDFEAGQVDKPNKLIPIYVLEINVS